MLAAEKLLYFFFEGLVFDLKISAFMCIFDFLFPLWILRSIFGIDAESVVVLQCVIAAMSCLVVRGAEGYRYGRV